MTKAVDLAKTSTKAGFNYLWGLIISTVISSVGTIFIANLLGSDAYGLYSIALMFPTLLFLFRDWGINSALTRYTAQYRAENRNAEIRSIFVSGILFELVVGTILSLFAFVFSGYFATEVFNRPELASMIQIASVSILSTGLVAIATAAFTGTEVTTYNSIMLIVQSAVKTFVIIGLVLLGLGTSGAVLGYTVATIVAGLVGLLLMYMLYRKLPKPFSLRLEAMEYTKEMLTFSVPLSMGAMIGGFLAQFYVFLLPIFYSGNSIIGNYNVALNFVVLISFFALPITTMLLPAFSKLDVKKDKDAFKNVFQYSVKYSALLVVPVAALVMCLSGPAVETLFPNKYDSAALFLSLLSITYLFSAAGNLSVNNLINSQGQTKLVLKFMLLTASIGFPMGYLLIMNFGVFGLIFTSITAPIPSLILSLIWIKKHYDLTVDWVSSAKILASSAIAATLTYLFVSLTSFSSVVELFMGAIFYVLFLVAAIVLTKTLNVNDLNSLRAMTTGLGPISKIVCLVLNIIQKAMIKLKLV